jgi:DNA-binding transcriptional LysR family regulator
MGIAPLPDVAAAAEWRAGSLARLAWTDQPLEVASHLVWNPQHQISPSLKLFLDFCADALSPEPVPALPMAH